MEKKPKRRVAAPDREPGSPPEGPRGRLGPTFPLTRRPVQPARRAVVWRRGEGPGARPALGPALIRPRPHQAPHAPNPGSRGHVGGVAGGEAAPRARHHS